MRSLMSLSGVCSRRVECSPLSMTDGADGGRLQPCGHIFCLSLSTKLREVWGTPICLVSRPTHFDVPGASIRTVVHHAGTR